MKSGTITSLLIVLMVSSLTLSNGLVTNYYGDHYGDYNGGGAGGANGGGGGGGINDFCYQVRQAFTSYLQAQQQMNPQTGGQINYLLIASYYNTSLAAVVNSYQVSNTTVNATTGENSTTVYYIQQGIFFNWPCSPNYNATAAAITASNGMLFAPGDVLTQVCDGIPTLPSNAIVNAAGISCEQLNKVYELAKAICNAQAGIPPAQTPPPSYPPPQNYQYPPPSHYYYPPPNHYKPRRHKKRRVVRRKVKKHKKKRRIVRRHKRKRRIVKKHKKVVHRRKHKHKKHRKIVHRRSYRPKKHKAKRRKVKGTFKVGSSKY